MFYEKTEDDVDLVGVKGKLTLEFYRFHIFTLRQAIFNVDGKSYQDKAQYGADMTYLSQFFDALYECKTDNDRQIWYNNFKDAGFSFPEHRDFTRRLTASLLRSKGCGFTMSKKHNTFG